MPGVETIEKFPVDFATPPSITAWSIGGEEYLVAFRWVPGEAVERPGVVGEFNHWNRTDLPMEGPDENGAYTVTAQLKAGEYTYKFVSGSDGWHTDPANPDKVDDGRQGYNSILRLGIFALLRGGEAVRGDGKIEHRGFHHDPANPTFFDLYTPDDVVLRFRTIRGDVEAADFELVSLRGQVKRVPMHRVASDSIFDYHEYHLRLSQHEDFQPVAYRFVTRDGEAESPSRQTWPLVMDPATMVDTPEWTRDAIWYQIMIDRFRDGDPKNNPEFTLGTNRIDITHPWNADWYTEQEYERRNGATFWKWAMYERLYGGDFQGVIDKLDYIASLGVNALYFNPVFEAHNSHKYNAKSFTHADDGYGTPGEFAASVAAEDFFDPATWEWNESDKKLLELIREAKARGIRVIFDGVFNHLGDDAVPFLNVKKNLEKSRFADWYEIVSWEPFKYRGWAGFDGLPQFAKTETGLASESLTKYIHDVTARWLDPNGDGDPSDGIDGWRLDVPGELPREFWREWRKHVKAINPDAYIVGEIWDPAEFWLDGTSFDAVMNYEFARAMFDFVGNKDAKISATEFDDRLGRLRIRYPRACTYVLQNLYDSHDTDRTVSRMMNPDMKYDGGNRKQDEGGENYNDSRPDDAAWAKLRLMALVQATYVGAPMIWYGTEVGMYGADDPMCRMPMWWEDLGPYGNPDYIILDDLREMYRELFHLRAEHEVLRRGDYRTVLVDDARQCHAFVRYDIDSPETITVVMNTSAEPQTVELQANEELYATGFKGWKQLHGGAQVRQDGRALIITIPPHSGTMIHVP